MEKISVNISELANKTDGKSQSLALDCTTELTSFDPTSGSFSFNTHCGTSLNSWDQEVQFKNWNSIVPEELRGADWDQIKAQVPDILNDDVKVHCGCPAFQYWGHQYNLTNDDDSAITPNTIAPRLNNNGYYMRDPDERHSCKHLVAVYHAFFV
jgi:hypothetical protein